MDDCLVCISDSHPYRVTNTKCRIDTVVSADDGHIVARNMYKGKAVPLQARRGSEGSRKLRFPDFVTKAQVCGRLSTLRTGRLYPQEMLLALISVRG